MIIHGDGGYSCLYRWACTAAPADWLSPKVGGHLVPFLYSSCEPRKLWQWLCYDYSTINIIVIIIIIIILITYFNSNDEYWKTMGLYAVEIPYLFSKPSDVSDFSGSTR